MVVFASLHMWVTELLNTCVKCVPSNGCNASLSSDGAWAPRSFAHFRKYFPLLKRGDTQGSGVSMPNWQGVKRRGSGVSSFTVHSAWHLIKVMLVSFSVPWKCEICLGKAPLTLPVSMPVLLLGVCSRRSLVGSKKYYATW